MTAHHLSHTAPTSVLNRVRLYFHYVINLSKAVQYSLKRIRIKSDCDILIQPAGFSKALHTSSMSPKGDTHSHLLPSTPWICWLYWGRDYVNTAALNFNWEREREGERITELSSSSSLWSDLPTTLLIGHGHQHVSWTSLITWRREKRDRRTQTPSSL